MAKYQLHYYKKTTGKWYSSGSLEAINRYTADAKARRLLDEGALPDLRFGHSELLVVVLEYGVEPPDYIHGVGG